MAHSKDPSIFTCGPERPQYDMVFIVGPRHDDLTKLKAKTKSSGLSCCFIGDGSENGHLTPEQVNKALEGKIGANTNVVICGHGRAHSNEHYIDIYQEPGTQQTWNLLSQLRNTFVANPQNAGRKLNINVYSCQAGATEYKSTKTLLTLHSSHEHTTLISMNHESILKSIERKQRAAASLDSPDLPYEDFIHSIITSPETCTYSENGNRFTARTADKPLSKDLRRYLENSIKEFLEFRRDELGHKTGDIDAEIIRLKTSIFGPPKHEEEAYNTKKEAESLKRYQELAMIMCCNRSSAAAALDYINTSLANGVDVNARLEDGTTALYMTYWNGRKGVAALLLENGADPNLARTDDGATPLYMACQNGHKDIAELLLENGADPNLARTTDGAIPLYMACQNGHKDIAELLLEKGADPNLATTNGATPLYMTCWNGRKGVTALLLEKGADPNLATTNGTTPLYMACQNGHKDIAELLLANGANPNLAITDDGTTPLYMTCWNGRKDIAELLLEKGANPNLATTNGATPLYMACWNGRKDIAELLLEKGANPNLARTTDGATPLYMACQNGHKDIAELLLANGANPNLARTDDGATPLYMACQNGHKDIAELLLANGANPNLARTTDGVTPFYIACQNGHKDIAELLLANGANIIAGMYNSFTPLMVAAVLGRKEVVQLLLNAIEGTDTLTRTADKNKAEEFCKSHNITMPDLTRAILGKTAAEMAKTPEIAKMIKDRTSELKAQECFVEGRYTRMLQQRQLSKSRTCVASVC